MSTTETSVESTHPAHADPSWELDLAGQWEVTLDRNGEGEASQWYLPVGLAEATAYPVTLPGSIQEQGIGDPVGPDTEWTGQVVDQSFTTDERYARYRKPDHYSVPFWLQPHTYYRGAAWFQRSFVVPARWAGRRVVLSLERVHWESTVWIGQTRIGSERSLSTAHEYDLGTLPPGEHRLTVRVDNRTVVDVGPNAHSISDHTQGNWNGIIGALTLRAVPAVTVRAVRITPDLATATAHVSVDIAADACGAGRGHITVSARRRSTSGHRTTEATGHDAPSADSFHFTDPLTATATLTATAEYDAEHGEHLASRGMTAGGSHVDLQLPLGADAQRWDEFHPALYNLTVELHAEVRGVVHHDVHETTFGLREVGVEGTQITVNGRRTFIRGTLESCVHPLTGFPPTTTEPWRRIIRIARAHGLNLLRFHSWCPPEAAFAAADEEGFYLQVEAPIWANQGAAVGEGRPVDQYLYEETERILAAYGNHPSFLLMAHGNEPAGRDAQFLGEWVEHFRRRDSRRLYTSAAGWPAITENDFDNIPGPRTYTWGEGLDSRLNAQPPETTTDYVDWVQRTPRPIISHEVGEWCVYPNFAEVEKYTGLMQPKNYGVFADFLAEAGMSGQAEQFLHASGRLQLLCYKEEVESALRTPGFGGFQLLGLNDFPGQGTALVGVLDAFWEEKPYTTSAEFARFCGPTVPLARLPQRVWRSDDVLTFEVQVAHFGAQPLDGTVSWRLQDESEATLDGGTVYTGVIAIGNAARQGRVEVPLDIVTSQRVKLVLTVDDGAEQWENDWDLWVFAPFGQDHVEPGHVEQDRVTDGLGGVLETADIDDALTRAAAGQTVLLLPPATRVATEVQLGFTTVFWNTAWTRNQAPHTLGITHDPLHPLFKGFPSSGHSDWQWWDLLQGAAAMVLDDLPQELSPLVQPIDTWFLARRLGVLLEARLGSGRLLVCTLNLNHNLQERPAAQHLRHSLLRYMHGDQFAPRVELNTTDVMTLFTHE